MGRKIPAKRHRGVKDPLVQQARREKSLKSKINAPPKDPDEQPIPRSLTRLFAFQNDKPNTKKRKKKSLDGEGDKERRNPVSGLRRLAGESGRSFSLRINSAVRALHADLAPDHYPEEMEAEDVKGERMAARRERKRRRAAAGRDPPLTRTQRLALKKKAKKEEADRLRAAEQREVQHERVSFGEVAHAPPALRGAGAADRPGRRPLLLTGLLQAAQADAVAAYRRLKRERRDADRAARRPPVPPVSITSGSLGNTWRQGDWRLKYRNDPKKVVLRNESTKK